MYPTHLIVPEYETNTGYRQCLRQIFQMNKDNYPDAIKQLEEDISKIKNSTYWLRDKKIWSK